VETIEGTFDPVQAAGIHDRHSCTLFDPLWHPMVCSELQEAKECS